MRRTYLLLAIALLPTPALAEADWFASLYTGDGIELRVDERVFTLYALLNVMGYDAAPVQRQYPIPKYQFHPVRREVRQRLAALDPEVKKQADAFFDAHPVPLSRYLAYTLRASPPPFSSGPKSGDFKDLKGLEALLGKVYATGKVDELMGSVQGEYRKAVRGYLTAVDGPMARARKLLRVGDGGPEALLVVNLLEAQDQVRGELVDKEVVLVVGPSEKPNVDGIVREYARVFVEPAARKAAAGWAGGAAVLREAQLAGAAEQNVGDFATALLSRAVAMRSAEASDAAYDAAAQAGYFGLKETARGLDEGKPLEAWAADALQKAETRRPAAKK